MFLKKQFSFLNERAASQGISVKDLVRALGPQGMNIGVSPGLPYASVYACSRALILFLDAD